LLRERARRLLETVQKDLSPYVQSDGTFRRKPDSPSGEVNVTTTCSCLMALALTNSFDDFYEEREAGGADAIFARLVAAPWMSSGLGANNAFTTALILRTFGFLEQEQLRRPASPQADQTIHKKPWELHLGITDAIGLARRLAARGDAASEYLWLSLTDRTRQFVARALGTTGSADTKTQPEEVSSVLAVDLRRLIQSGWIYNESRFTKTSQATKRILDNKPTGYALAEANHLLLIDEFPAEIAPRVGRTLQEIAELLGSDPDNFSINEYPPSATVLYWFVDGLSRAKLSLRPEHWRDLCSWAANEFNHERSLVVAEHQATMDPTAMGMAACLCARLRTIIDDAALGTKKDHLSILPSVIELERSIQELISRQAPSGIWNKYFPLFHYQDAGSNFCFTFELLEAVLNEFGGSTNRILDLPAFIDGLKRAVTWCEDNRLRYSVGAIPYTGWNSGHFLATLRKGQPESWASAVVHMFLWELDTVLSERIQQRVLEKYKSRPTTPRPLRTKTSTAKTATSQSPELDALLDIEVILQGEPESLTSVLRDQIVANYKDRTEKSIRRNPPKKPLSALLFGPPGTSKTQLTKALASDLNWPLLELTPADFVRGTLANVYLQADEIFDDLMDLAGVVVFFDEMDALVQTREGEFQLDIASQFLTTTMLPKLTRLHDQAKVVFFMATNFQDRFDAAIKRSGRFDLLLCMGPPKLSEKLDRLHRAYFAKKETPQTLKAGALVQQFLKRAPKLREQLQLYTFGEFRAFVKSIGGEHEIGDKVEALGGAEFRKRLTEYSKFVSLKLSDLSPLRKLGVNWTRLTDLDEKEFTLKQLEKKNLEPTPIIRYLCDRRESKIQ
jgi:hypothetical protein